VTTLRSAPGSRAGLTSWPLTPIEELDLYLESAAEPSLIQLETLVRGHLDAAALESAVADALAADPAARRQLAAASRWGRRLRWEVAEVAPVAGDAGHITVASWRSTGQLAALREWVSAWPIPLRDRAARLILAVGPEHDIVILQTHHAAFDGISSLALLAAIGAAYRGRAGDAAGLRPQTIGPDSFGPQTMSLPAPRSAGTARPAGTPGRAGTADPAGTAGPAGTAQAGGIPVAVPRGCVRFPGVVTRIAARTASPERPGYGSVHRSMPVPRPDHHGSGPFPTVNDLLVAALIAAVERWNAAQGARSERIRISVPVNARDRRDRWAGPGNQSRLIRVSASRGERTDLARLLAQVAAQTRAGKQRRSGGLDATSRMLGTGWAPAAIKRAAARLARRVAAPLCTDTALLSNLGVLPDPPSFSGDGSAPIWFAGPAQMPRGLGVGAVTTGGRLHLCVHYRHALLDRSAAADFTALYCQTLAEMAGGTP
jgi:NRPS condensation-like uncharacterized protein